MSKTLISMAIIFVFSLAAVNAEAHNRQLSKKDGCHKASDSNVRHGHWDRDRKGPVVVVCNADGTFSPITVTKTEYKDKIIERVIDPSPGLWDRVATAEYEKDAAVHDKVNAVNQSRKDRQVALLATQDANKSKYLMLNYERRMEAMERNEPACLNEKATTRAVIKDDPYRNYRYKNALTQLLDCLAIGQ